MSATGTEPTVAGNRRTSGMCRACVKTQNQADLQTNWGCRNCSQDDDRRLQGVLCGHFFDRGFSSAFFHSLCLKQNSHRTPLPGFNRDESRETGFIHGAVGVRDSRMKMNPASVGARSLFDGVKSDSWAYAFPNRSLLESSFDCT